MNLLPFDWTPGPGPRNQRLAAAIRSAITGGRLRPGERLPATRLLAEDLGVSRWVVTEAYEQLKAEGYLASRTGSGSCVTATHRRVPVPPGAVGPAGAEGTAYRPRSPNMPELRSFPRTAWKAALRSAVDGTSDRDLGYGDPLGDPELRQVLSDYLRRVRGIDADPVDVIVTSGTAHGLGVVLRTLAASGRRRLAVEDPTWPLVLRAASAAGLTCVPVPVDDRGIRAGTLARHRADAAFVTPAHQYPTGVVLAPERREELLAWADGGRLVIEDDYDAEFRYGRPPVPALASLARDTVVYLGSSSKTLAPVVRVGWMVVAGGHREAVARTVHDDRAGPSTVEQRALARLISDGGYDRHLRRMRRVYQARRSSLVAALADRVPSGRVVGLDAGVHLLLDIAGADERAAVRVLTGQGVDATALGDHRAAPGGAAGLLIGYGNIPDHGVDAVASAVAAALGAAPGPR